MTAVPSSHQFPAARTDPAAASPADLAASFQPGAPAGPRLPALLGAAALAASMAAAVTAGYAELAGSISIPMRAGSMGAARAEPITAGNFVVGVLVCTFWGTVVAVLLRRFARHPRIAFVRAAASLVVLSLAGPAFAIDTPSPPS
jgi:hypothetical protein